MNATKISCPKCSTFLDVEDDTLPVLCPNCGNEFTPGERGAVDSIISQAAETAGRNKAEKVLARARDFKVLAWICFAAVLVCIFGWIVASASAGDDWTAAGCLASASWFLKGGLFCYLIAQVLHIRANTEGK